MNNIGRIIGGGNNYIGGFGAKKQEEAKDAKQQEQVLNNHADTQVDSSKVLDYLAANNVYVNQAKAATVPAELDADTKARVADSMAEFEAFMNGAVAELGDENLALMLADVYSERN